MKFPKKRSNFFAGLIVVISDFELKLTKKNFNLDYLKTKIKNVRFEGLKVFTNEMTCKHDMEFINYFKYELWRKFLLKFFDIWN